MTRLRLPARRRCETVTATLGGHKLHVSLGYYPDGRLGEVFVAMDKVGSFSRAMLDTLGRALSRSLQHGATAEEVRDMLCGVEFDPAGTVGGVPGVKKASSVVDLVGQVVGGTTRWTIARSEGSVEP